MEKMVIFLHRVFTLPPWPVISGSLELLIWPTVMITLFIMWEVFYDGILMDKELDPRIMHIYQMPARVIAIILASSSIEMFLVLTFWYWNAFDAIFNRLILHKRIDYIGNVAETDRLFHGMRPWVYFTLKIIFLIVALYMYIHRI